MVGVGPKVLGEELTLDLGAVASWVQEEVEEQGVARTQSRSSLNSGGLKGLKMTSVFRSSP